MKKGEIGEGIIEKVDFPNKGMICTEDGEKVIVKNTVPGQRVRFSVQKKRNGKCEGRLLEVLEKSPLELGQAVCVHFGSCGGCTYQNLDYEQQLRLKEAQVKEMLQSVVETPVSTWFEGIKPSPAQFEYRNKMEFSFGDEYKDGPLALGMHKRGSFYDLVTACQCRITDADYDQILKTVLSYFTKEEVSYFKKNSHLGYLRHLLVRKAAKTGEILVDLITTTQDCGRKTEAELLDGFRESLLQLQLQGRIVGILHTKNDSIADAVKNEGTELLYGQDHFYEELLGLKFKISVFSFFQTNSLAAEVLYETVREFIGDSGQRQTGVLYDLYAGTGTIAQMMAPAVRKVIGVEIVKEAVLAARENAKLNGLENCVFIAGDVLKVLDTIDERPDVIVLDPPREGVHPKALKKIAEDIRAEKIVYISCKPTSLVRDLVELQKYSYQVGRVCCVDMFPGTVHVETVVLLTHEKATSYIEVTMDYDTIVSEYKPKVKVTYKMIMDYIKEKYNFNVHSTTIAEIKRSLGLKVGDYNKKDDANYRKEKITPEKRKAVEETLRHFEIIQ